MLGMRSPGSVNAQARVPFGHFHDQILLIWPNFNIKNAQLGMKSGHLIGSEKMLPHNDVGIKAYLKFCCI